MLRVSCLAAALLDTLALTYSPAPSIGWRAVQAGALLCCAFAYGVMAHRDFADGGTLPAKLR